MLQRFKGERGFTTFELLVSITIISILIPFLMYFMLQIYERLSTTSAFDDQSNDFRVYSHTIANDLLFSENIYAKNENNRIVLYYTTQLGKNKAVVFDEEDGTMIEWDTYTNERTFITNIKKYDEQREFVEQFDNGKLRFNVYAEDINALMLFTIDSRENGVYK